jgi:hypothetical protein
MKVGAPGALLALGLAQMAGDAARLLPLKALALATAASPAPRVFSKVESLAVTPETYVGLAGPYNRRNAYGAAMAGGPMMAGQPLLRPMFEAVARHGLCGDAPVLRELGVDPSVVVGPPRVRYEPRAMRRPRPSMVIHAPCR